jgi:hypothetical protein
VSGDRDGSTMAEQNKKATGGVPLANITVLLAMLGGAALYRFLPLTSPRPVVEPARGTLGWGGQDVDARLWQDPLEVSRKHREDVARGLAAKDGDGPAEIEAHGLKPVRSLLHGKTTQTPGDGTGSDDATPPKILGVMVPGGAYEEHVERRLRTRHAVVEGLSALGFTPDDYLHIGYFETKWPIKHDDLKQVSSNSLPGDALARSLTVPYEWYRAPASKRPDLLVLWLPADAFASRPLTRLAALLGSLRSAEGPNGSITDDAEPIPAAIIGPRTSNDLVAMSDEPGEDWAKSILAQVRMYSAFASASDAVLGTDGPMTIEKTLAKRFPSFQLSRTIPSDSDLMACTVGELGRRGVWKKRSGRVVLLAELDTVYSRGLADTFVKVLHNRKNDASCQDAPPSDEAPPDGSIETIFYPEGIDGKVPTDRKDDKTPPSGTPPEKTDGQPREATEGANQSDYLRRLAERLRKDDADSRWQGHDGITAVGVLGADVFDKIMILRALRRALPGAIFFTNNLDARLMDTSEWSATHNLIVASTYGLEPDDVGTRPGDGKAKPSYPPFRDAYETSAFTATLAALRPAVSLGLPPVRLYEIGRFGPVPLEKTRAVPWWTPGRWAWSIVGVTCLIGLLIWAKGMHEGTLAPTTSGEPSPRCKLEPPSLSDVLTKTPVFLMFVCVPAIIALFRLAQHLAEQGGEPVSLFEGVSIWPSEALRLLVGLLGVHFVAKSIVAIKKSNGELEKAFHLDDGMSQPSTVSVDGVEHVVASRTWAEYVRAGQPFERFKRVVLPFLVYYLFGWSLIGMLGFPRVPGRGQLDPTVNLVITVLFAATVTIFLLFFVIDVMWLNRVMLVKKLMDLPTRWPEKLLREYRPESDANPKVDACLSELLDIKLIAARTAVTGPLIYWPFLLIALTIVSRLSYFDDWDFPVALIVVFALNAGGAIFAAVTLRQSAEYARKRALEILRKLLSEATISHQSMVPDPRDRAVVAAAKSAIEEVENMNTGAFGSFAQNPVVQAILLPGGASILAAAQALLQ